MGDGHLNKCKVCAKNDSKQQISLKSTDPEWVLKERNRCRIKTEHFRKENPEKYKKICFDHRIDQKRYKYQKRARGIANRAKKNGLLIQPTFCQNCLIEYEKLQMHHEDHSRPLDVKWLCSRCHGLESRKRDIVIKEGKAQFVH